MPADLLVSFINAGPGQEFTLGCVDSGTGALAMVDLHGIRAVFPFYGMTGLCRFGDGVVVGVHGLARQRSALAFLDQDLRVLDVVRLQRARDVHSIVALADTLFIASSGTDEVIAFTPSDGRERVVYAATTAGTDTVHLNGLCDHHGRLVASMFGPHQANAVRSGAVVDCGSGATLLSGLRQPHSVSSAGEHLLVLESATGHLIKFDAHNVFDQWVIYAGYVRGLCWSDGRLVVGRSRRRIAHRHDVWSQNSLVSLPARDGDEHAQTALLIRDAHGANSVIRLTWSANEIYDILPLTWTPAPTLLPDAWVAAYAALNRNDPATAERLLADQPGSPALPTQLLAQARLVQDDIDGAADAIAAIGAGSPPDFMLLNLLSTVRTRQGAAEDAAAAAAQAHAMLPESDDAALLLARRLVQAERFDAAGAVLRRLLEAGVNERLWKELSLLFDQVGLLDPALQTAERAVACEPLNAQALIQLARMLRKHDRPAEAVAPATLACACDPSNARAFAEVGTILAQMNDLAGAITALERACALNPEGKKLQQRLQGLRTRLQRRRHRGV